MEEGKPMQPRRNPFGPALILLLAVMAGGWFLRQGVAQDQGSTADVRVFQEVFEHIAERYVDEVERDRLYEHAIQGILRELGDPNTSLMNVEAFENFRVQTEGDYGGVGLEITDRDEFITVVSPLPGTPGSRAGIRAGDMIIEVNGDTTRDWPVQQAVQVLRGQPGTDVQVQIRRPGVADPIEFTLVREQIQLFSVPFSTMLEGGVGYIPLGMFSETSTREVRQAADSLRSEGATSFLLDLRGNPGGLLDQGIGITDLFLPSGVSVVETRGRDGNSNQVLRTSSPDRYEGMPVIVLVDRGSASASEIVAGALQDHDRALVLGASTFGKGSVQSLFGLSTGHVLKLTTARWYTPQGRSIERVYEDLDDQGVPVELTETDHLPITVNGTFVMPADTAGRPVVTSSAGRPLYGGGGIVPDVLIMPDTLTTGEQEAARALLQEWGRFSLGVFDYSVDFLNRHGDDPVFTVTEEDLGNLFERLRDDRELTVDRETFFLAERLVRFELESEIANRGWGNLQAFHRSIPFDAPLERAARLLREAESPEDLFVRAGAADGLASSAALAGQGAGN
jgi:carboxyl-terminal processing protease